jgi:hypothetical protein
VTELEIGETLDLTAAFEDAQVGIEGDFSQRNNNLNAGKHFQFPFQERPAIAQFQRRGLVVGRCAMGRRRNPGIGKLQTVLRVMAFGPGGKSSLVEGSVEEVAGTISREHTSSTISAMGAWRQADNQQPRRYIAERRNRFTPVVPVEESPAFRDRDFAAVADQARAAFALDYLVIQRDKVTLAGFRKFGWEH